MRYGDSPQRKRNKNGWMKQDGARRDGDRRFFALLRHKETFKKNRLIKLSVDI